MADAREPEEGGSDLFDRWLSHRQESTGDDPRPRTYGVPRTGLAGAGLEDGPARTTAADADEGQAVLPATEPDAAETPPDGAPLGEAPVAEESTSDAPVGEAPRTEARGPARPEAGTVTGEAASSPSGTPAAAAGKEASTAPEPPERRAEPPAAPAGEETGAAPEPPERRAPVGLDEFEPVVIASVRRAAETPVEKRSRLARFRRTGLEPDPADDAQGTDDPSDDPSGDPAEVVEPEASGEVDDPVDVPADVPVDVPAPVPTGVLAADVPADVPAPVPTADVPADVPPDVVEPEDSGAVDPGPVGPATAEDVTPTPAPEILTATESGAETETEDAPPPSPPGRTQDAAAAVFAAFNPGTAPATGASASTGTAPETATGPATGPAAGAPPDAAAPAQPRQRARRTRPTLTAYVEAARTTLDRSVRGTPEERTPSDPAPAAPTPTDPPATRRTPEPASGSEAEAATAPARSAYDELRAQREAAAPPLPDVLPPSIDFRPRTLARRVTSVLLLVGLVATGIAAWRAYDSRVETDIGLAAILALATGVVWAARAGSVPTRVGLHGGVLEVRSQAGRFVFEVTGAHTRLEVVGTPGRHGSRLLVHRRGLAPFAITPAMVDLRELVEALHYYRPDL